MSEQNMLVAKKTVAEIQQMYNSSPSLPYVHGIIAGAKGVGKTSLIETAPKPVLVHSFDPDGTSVLDRGMISRGEIVIDASFENDNMRNPKAFLLWQERYNALGRAGVFEHFASYFIDSLTTMTDSLLWQIMKKEGRILPSLTAPLHLDSGDGKGMRRQDWGTFLQEIINMIRASLNSLPCHTFLLAHIGRYIDDITGVANEEILIPGKAKDKIPINTSELWILKLKPTPKGVERCLVTRGDGMRVACTRIGKKDLFEMEEPADIRALLKKAGVSWEDKPLIFGKEDEQTIPKEVAI